MKDWKKILFTCMALAVAFTGAVGCTPQEGEDSSSSSSSSSSSNSSDNKQDENEYLDTYLDDCTLGEWELVRAADCETQGVKVRRCTNHAGKEHEDYEFFAAREHSYDSKGVCTVCSKELTLPKANADAKYINPADPDADIIGSGDEYPTQGNKYSGKYEFYVDEYYQVEIGQTGKCWFRFGVDAPGQYAVISTSNPKNVSLQQYTDNIDYENGETKYFEDGNFLAVVSCTELYYSKEWRSAYCLTGNPGDVVKFYIAQVAPPTWEAGYVYVDQLATQINGKAPEGKEGTTPVEVPYTGTYFYDEDCGFYRMGTKASPGELIYMAITAPMPRLLGNNSFVGLQTEGVGLRCKMGTTVEGDHLMGAYAPMIYSNSDYGGTENSYQAYMNSDGLYPVTQELYKFLQLYTAQNSPIDPPEEEYKENAWLSACFYYGSLTPGASNFPHKISAPGTYTATQFNKYDKVYYQFTPTFEQANATSMTCTITVETEGAWFWLDGVRHSAADGAVTFTATVADGVTIAFMYQEMEIRNIKFTISAV